MVPTYIQPHGAVQKKRFKAAKKAKRYAKIKREDAYFARLAAEFDKKERARANTSMG